MRFLGIGDYNSLGDMYWHLAIAGHDVRVCVREPEAHGIYAGLVQRVDSWERELDWIAAAGRDGIVIIETASLGETADALRRRGFHVVGGSAWTDRIERDRAFGQAVMRDAGLQTAPTHGFRDYAAALAFLRERPARYVFKFSDGESASTRNYVGEMDDGSDIVTLIEREQATREPSAAVEFVLMEHVAGIEVGIGAYFNGDAFLEPACIDWEHKRFFPGDVGELTGEMGTVVSYRGSRRLFDLTLAKIAPGLRAAGFHGYINVNTIVNAAGVWPLEFTSRFGYPGFAICDALHTEGWDRILYRMAHGVSGAIGTRDGYAVGVVITVPPFPYEYGYAELSKGERIRFRDEPAADERRHFHYGEVALSDAGPITSGSIGYIMVVTGTGADIAAAQDAAYRRVRNVVVRNMRYRNDIGDRLKRTDLSLLRTLGYFDDAEHAVVLEKPSSAR
ncbi:MAG: phosphoribosylglycinamide synthetase C domain-containing protein [Rhodanobacteraceae bacterium]